MATFNGVSFHYERTAATQRAVAAAVSVRHIPGGDTVYIDVGGRLPRSLTIAVIFDDAANAAAFEGQVGNSGTLVSTPYTGLALLRSVTSGAVQPTGQIYASAEFVLL
jgi:hypothetical protein